MELTIDQRDALTELINIGYGRAAGALSELTGYRITLEVPQVTIHKIEAIGPMLEKVIDVDVASVQQAFSGAIAGSAMLLLDEQAALTLSRLLVDEPSAARDFDAGAREIITEVGNILLNACLGVFGNLLRVQVEFKVPRLSVQSVRSTFKSAVDEAAEALRYGLVVHTRFYIKAGDVSGYLVIVLGLSSFDRLLRELEKWEARGGGTAP
ncbi:MAG TPA: chemotaxis protein CheC [Opitutaceae bacterium]|jgi:chemotaxis protein CheC|nr:chemotaxis protein CheC [Opitutaceae bacterium]